MLNISPALIAVGLVLSPPARAEDDDVARAAVVGYGANLRSFDPVRCTFTYRLGFTSTEANAKAGRLKTIDTSCQAVLTMAGTRIRIDRVGVPFAIGVSGKSSTPIAGTNLARMNIDFCVEGLYMSNGTEDMAFDTGRAVNIYTPDLTHQRESSNPLATGAFDWRLQATPDRMMDQPESYEFKGEGIQSLDGTPTVRARFVKKATGEAWVVDFDPARGYLPLRTQRWMPAADRSRPAELITTSWLLDARECGRGRFFPMRFTSISAPDENIKSWMAWETIVPGPFLD